MENTPTGDKPVQFNLSGPEGSSASIAKLSLALAKAQGEIQHALKDEKNPHFNSKFASLASVLDACRIPLTKNELSVFQKIEGEVGKLFIVTILAHSSGEWMSSRLPLIVNKNDMQGLGSALTYGRRYSLSAMVGVAQEDDDGNSAGQVQPKGQDQKPPPQKKKDDKPQPPTLDQLISVGMKKNGWTLDQLNMFVGQVYSVKPGQKLPDEKKKELIEKLNKFTPESAFQELESKNTGEDEAKVEVKLPGCPIHGRKIGECPEPDLLEALKWLDKELENKTHPKNWTVRLLTVKGQVTAFLKSVGAL